MNNKYGADEFSVRPNTKDLSGRQGIALVVVLGFLAVLTIMAVGMAISMRTERLASRSYLDMVEARLLCQSALADSMMFLEETAASTAVGPTNLFMPNWRQYFNTFSEGQELLTVFGDASRFGNGRLILPSIDPDAGEPDIFTNSLISGLATNYIPYIPGLLWRGLYQNEKGMGTEGLRGKAQWIHTTKEDESGKEIVNGRYMYIVFNASGRFDLNYLGRRVAPYNHDMKLKGENLQSIDKTLANHIIDNVRYETSSDLNDDINRFGFVADSWTIAGETPWELTEFSYFPPMRRVDVDFENNRLILDDMAPAFLSTNANELANSESNIKAAFDKAIRTSNWKNAEGACDANDLYNLLGDYVDEDRKPHDLKVPNVEAIPMINEIQTHTSNIVVEVWEPFVGPDRYDGGFTVNVHVDGNKDSKKGTIPNIDKNSPVGPVEVDVELATPIPEGGGDLTVSIEIRGKTGSTVKVDEVVFRGVQRDQSWQCNDPRFNHLVSQWKKTSENTLGEINENADYASNPESGEYLKDGDYLMYCANKPLCCTGELGYLPVAPWRTIKLYEDPRGHLGNMDPVLDYFTMFPTDRPVYGMLNPNEKYHYPSQARAAFYGNWGYYLDHNSSFSKFNYLTKMDKPRGGRLIDIGTKFLNISDLGLWLYDDDSDNYDRKPEWVKEYKGNNYSELRIEHMMRRASALCHVRQTLYIVCMWAQSLGAPEDGDPKDWGSYSIKAEAQAVAMVWRDPYPVSNDNQNHRKFVRFMRWME